MEEASVLEVFSSRQGEGLCVGDPQVFVRFGGCNLVCDYCDTPESIPAKSGHSQSVAEVAQRVDDLSEDPSVAVSLTGGEPLMQVGFLEQLIPDLRKRGHRIYLETNGALPQALAKILDGCDWIAMDIKPASAVGRNLWEAHRWFLELGAKKIFVKMVLTDRTHAEELQQAVELVAQVRTDIPFVLQPATPIGAVGPLPLAVLASWWELASKRLQDVRVIPQIHRLWGLP